MNNRNSMRDKFKEYLDRKLDPNRAEQIVFSSQKSTQSLRFSNSPQINFENINKSPTNSSCHSFDSSIFLCTNSNSRGSRRSNQSNCKTISMKKRLKKLRDIEQNVCSICLQPYKDRVAMSCKHSYCDECLQEWLKSSSKCPYCRANCQYYIKNGQMYEIQSKQFEYEEAQQFEEGLDYQCYMCEQTIEGDQVLICDRCQLYACHPRCDPRLRGVVLDDDDPWYCHFCS